MSKDVIVPTHTCLAATDNQPCYLMKNVSRIIKIYKADRCEDLTFWIALLTLLAGYMFPNPKI